MTMAYTFKTLDFPSATKTEAFAINENGQIVGFYVDSTGLMHGFLDQNNVFTTIDDPLGTNNPLFGNSAATGINNPGTIVGYYFDATGIAHGCIESKCTLSTVYVLAAVRAARG